MKKAKAIAVIIGTIATVAMTVAGCTRDNMETFAVADGNGSYHYATEYAEKATYENGSFITSDGNIWMYEGAFEEGKTYTLWMHDNGTEGNIYDDVIMDVYND